MRRLTAFSELITKPYYSSLYAKLSKAEVALCIDLIDSHHHLEAGPFESAMDRYFLGKDRPKRWTIVLELVVACK
jgi:hypothetical protein